MIPIVIPAPVYPAANAPVKSNAVAICCGDSPPTEFACGPPTAPCTNCVCFAVGSITASAIPCTGSGWENVIAPTGAVTVRPSVVR